MIKGKIDGSLAQPRRVNLLIIEQNSVDDVEHGRVGIVHIYNYQ